MIGSILRHSRGGFTLVELLIGMTIFSVGMTAILALLQSTIGTSLLSRHEIIASNLLREQIELIKNTRNSNVRSFVDWSKIRTENVASSTLTGGIYILENEFSSTGVIYNSAGDILSSPVYMKDITLSFPVSGSLESKFLATRLSFDDHKRYTHSLGELSNFASYIIISPLIVSDGALVYEPKKDGKYQGYLLDARVITKGRFGYREYDLKTIITDWKK